VKHAHQKGIIHRDLKPGNILVALYDGQPVPKIIDPGVAKATSRKLTEKTMFTRAGQVVGTLEFMSPEQTQVNQLDIDTRSAIYSPGVCCTSCSPVKRPLIVSVCDRPHSTRCIVSSNFLLTACSRAASECRAGDRNSPSRPALSPVPRGPLSLSLIHI
jgi:serine/threonine protein kinase